MQVLITGANGFVGRALCRTLLSRGVTTYGTIRSHHQVGELPQGVRPVVISSLNDLQALDATIDRVDGIVHLAARVHQMKETTSDPLAAYRATNSQATTNLARWGAGRGVRRFVFLSSVKVNGEGQSYSETSHTYTEKDAAAPQDPYGISKWEAEQGLRQVVDETGLETVILRPTLIYGPEVKANFRQLLRLVRAGMPLPLGRMHNVRSLIYLENLVDAIRVSLSHENAAGQTFLVSDGLDLSTPEVIRSLALAFAQPARLFPFSPRGLEFLGRITGKSATLRRLLGTLRVDSRRIREELQWTPPYTPHEGLAATAAWYREQCATVGHKGTAA